MLVNSIKWLTKIINIAILVKIQELQDAVVVFGPDQENEEVVKESVKYKDSEIKALKFKLEFLDVEHIQIKELVATQEEK
jgi:hypothetical protein